MLSAKHRFHRRNHVIRVMRSGRTIRGRSVSIRYVIDQSQTFQVAVIVSKKVAKRAVVRNRIRRRVYEAVRNNHQHIQPGFRGAFVVFDDSIADQPFDQLSTMIGELLSQAQ